MYPGSSPISYSPFTVSLVVLTTTLFYYLLVTVRRGRGEALLRPVAFSFSVPGPSVRALVGPPFLRLRCLFPFLFPSPPTGLPCFVRCLSCWVWGATLAHRTRH